MGTNLQSSLGSIEGTGKYIQIPSSSPYPALDVPVFLPKGNTTNFTSSGNFTFGPGVFDYFNNFTIDTGHQMTLSAGLTVIRCTGTFTVGGNGIIGATSSITIGDTRGYVDRSGSTGGPGGGSGGNNGTAGILAGGGGSGGSSVSGVAGSLPDAITGAGGSGGGGGSRDSGQGGSGSVGSPGPILIVFAKDIVVNGDINVSGQDGTSPANQGANNIGGAGGGGGGVGGEVHLIANGSYTYTSGTISVNGGNGGNGANGGTNAVITGGGGGGQGGRPGVIRIAALAITGSTVTSATPGTGGTGGSGYTTGTGGAGGSGLTLSNFNHVEIITGDLF